MRIVVDADDSAREMLEGGSVRIRIWKDGTNPDTESATWPADAEAGGTYSGPDIQFPISETFIQGGRDEVTGERLPGGFTVKVEMSETIDFPDGSAKDGATYREYVPFPTRGGSTERFTLFGACARRTEPCPEGSQCYEDGTCADDVASDGGVPDSGGASAGCMLLATEELVALEEHDYGFTNPPGGIAEALAVCQDGTLDAQGAFWETGANGKQLTLGGQPVAGIDDASCENDRTAIIAGDRLFSRADIGSPWMADQSPDGEFVDVLATESDLFVLTETNLYRRGSCEVGFVQSETKSNLLYLARVEGWGETFVASSDGKVFRLVGTSLEQVSAPGSADLLPPYVAGFYGSLGTDRPEFAVLRYIDTYGSLWQAAEVPMSRSSWTQIEDDVQVGALANNGVDLIVVGSQEVRIWSTEGEGGFVTDAELTEVINFTGIVPTRGVANGSQALLLGARGLVLGRDGTMPIRSFPRTSRSLTEVAVNGEDRFIAYSTPFESNHEDRAYLQFEPAQEPCVIHTDAPTAAGYAGDDRVIWANDTAIVRGLSPCAGPESTIREGGTPGNPYLRIRDIATYGGFMLAGGSESDSADDFSGASILVRCRMLSAEPLLGSTIRRPAITRSQANGTSGFGEEACSLGICSHSRAPREEYVQEVGHAFCSSSKCTVGSWRVQMLGELDRLARTSVPSISIRHARRLLQGSRAPNPWIYFGDFTLTSGLMWTLLVLGTQVTGVISIAALTLTAGLVMTRAILFVHEVSHLREGTLPGFRLLWNALVGIPLLAPSSIFETSHLDHHKVHVYRTAKDPELNPAGAIGKQVISFILAAAATPPLLFVRWLVLAPISWLVPRTRPWILRYGSSLTANVNYKPRVLSGSRKRHALLCEAACFVHSATIAALVATGVVSVQALLVTTGAIFVAMSITTMRSIILHRHSNEGRWGNLERQVRDSINVPHTGLASAILLPLGIGYHALHHLDVAVPYHEVRNAHRILMRELPDSSLYKQNTSNSIWSAIREAIAHDHSTL